MFSRSDRSFDSNAPVDRLQREIDAQDPRLTRVQGAGDDLPVIARAVAERRRSPSAHTVLMRLAALGKPDTPIKGYATFEGNAATTLVGQRYPLIVHPWKSFAQTLFP